MRDDQLWTYRAWGGLAALGFSAVLSASAWAQAPVAGSKSNASASVRRFFGIW